MNQAPIATVGEAHTNWIINYLNLTELKRRFKLWEEWCVKANIPEPN